MGNVLSTTRHVELIEKKKFAVIALHLEHETFIVHIVVLRIYLGDEVYSSKRAQISHLKADEAPTKVPSKYADFTDVFSPKLAAKLSEHTRINNHAIKLVDDWQPPYNPIYSLRLVELERLKTYIKNNLANGFIRPSKSPARTLIFFDKKPEKNLRLCKNY